MGMKSFLLRCYRHVEYKRANYLIDCKKGKKITISISDLLSCNFKDNLLGRYDIIVRLLTVEKYGKRQENSFIMYEKMQNSRVRGGILIQQYHSLKNLWSPMKTMATTEIHIYL